MDFLIPIFVVGFCILGTYKVFELFTRRKERILLIEKLASLSENEGDDDKRLKIQFPSFGTNDSGSWSLRISLLLIGIGAGCLVAFFIQVIYFNSSSIQSYWDWANQFRELIVMANFASISFFGGIGLLVAFLLEQKKKAEKKD
ncbi:MAG: hypothetical protein FWD60_11750 [Candidatus Azobacteroides sp.]|nr:hypothetical protein [Candidatus Azobacteroides sp.]